jgi:hypothetical protein
LCDTALGTEGEGESINANEVGAGTFGMKAGAALAKACVRRAFAGPEEVAAAAAALQVAIDVQPAEVRIAGAAADDDRCNKADSSAAGAAVTAAEIAAAEVISSAGEEARCSGEGLESDERPPEASAGASVGGGVSSNGTPGCDEDSGRFTLIVVVVAPGQTMVGCGLEVCVGCAQGAGRCTKK